KRSQVPTAAELDCAFPSRPISLYRALQLRTSVGLFHGRTAGRGLAVQAATIGPLVHRHRYLHTTNCDVHRRPPCMAWRRGVCSRRPPNYSCGRRERRSSASAGLISPRATASSTAWTESAGAACSASDVAGSPPRGAGGAGWVVAAAAALVGDPAATGMRGAREGAAAPVRRTCKSPP